MTEDFSDDVRGLLKEAQLGIEVSAFLDTDIGMALMGRAQMEACDAMDALKDIKRSAFDSDQTFIARINELQGNVRMAENFELWLAQLVDDGRAAEQVLDESNT
jgi:hypothetical protein